MHQSKTTIFFLLKQSLKICHKLLFKLIMQEESIPEGKKFLNERQDKEQRISMQLIAETSLDQKLKQNVSEEEKIDVLIRLKSIHLQWLSIKKIENLEVFSDLRILYLQHNRISKMEGLDHLINLEYLALNDNKICKVQNVNCLKTLLGLNLNNNDIQDLDQKQLPENLQLLSFKNNPVCLDIDYKQKILKRLQSIEMLDDQTITPAERFKILGIFPQKLLSYASQMRQFYTKKEVQARLDEQNKRMLINTEGIDQKLILNQMHEKTRAYANIAKEGFEKQLKEQIDDFNQKIEVSKKIRNIKQKEEKERQKRITEIKQTAMSQLMNNYNRK